MTSVSRKAMSGRPRSSGGRVGQMLHVAHAVVAEVAHGAAHEGRQILEGRHPVPGQVPGHEGEGVAAVRGQVVVGVDAAAPDGDGVAGQPDALPGLDAQEGVAAEAQTLLGALQQEAAGRLPQLEEGRDRGLGVVQEAVRDRDDVIAGAEPPRLFERGRGGDDAGCHGRLPFSASEKRRLLSGGRAEPSAVEAGEVAGVAGGAGLLDEGEQGVAVAVVAQLVDLLEVARGGALVPVLVARAAEEPGGAGLERPAERLGVHVGEHEDLAGGPLLDDARHEAPGVELDRAEESAAWRAGARRRRSVLGCRSALACLFFRGRCPVRWRVAAPEAGRADRRSAGRWRRPSHTARG